jgi:hypothetical protein
VLIASDKKANCQGVLRKSPRCSGNISKRQIIPNCRALGGFCGERYFQGERVGSLCQIKQWKVGGY